MAREPITQKWGLIVDQDRCTGCNACVVACSMENNIPFMGEDNVANGRGMYWIFNKRTWSGEYPDVLPISTGHCLQCGSAPLNRSARVFCFRPKEKIINCSVQPLHRNALLRQQLPYHSRQFIFFDPEPPTPMDSYLKPGLTLRRRGRDENAPSAAAHRLQGRG